MLGFAFYLQPCLLPLMAEMPPGAAGVRLMTASVRTVVLGVATVVGPREGIGFQVYFRSRSRSCGKLTGSMCLCKGSACEPVSTCIRHCIGDGGPGSSGLSAQHSTSMRGSGLTGSLALPATSRAMQTRARFISLCASRVKAYVTPGMASQACHASLCLRVLIKSCSMWQVYIAIGVFAAARYGEDTAGNVLVNTWLGGIPEGVLDLAVGAYLSISIPPMLARWPLRISFHACHRAGGFSVTFQAMPLQHLNYVRMLPHAAWGLAYDASGLPAGERNEGRGATRLTRSLLCSWRPGTRWTCWRPATARRSCARATTRRRPRSSCPRSQSRCCSRAAPKRSSL